MWISRRSQLCAGHGALLLALLVVVTPPAPTSSSLAPPHGLAPFSDHDCDNDGEDDCGRWDVANARCRTPSVTKLKEKGFQFTCEYRYLSFDLNLGQSCRCARVCPKLPSFFKPYLYTHKDNGVTGRWFNWGRHLETCAPWVMPKSLPHLLSIVAHAAKHGFRVRPGGATHSAPGIVTEGRERDIVVSLARYTTRVGPHKSRDIFVDEEEKTVWVNAGWSFLDLYRVIRPLNLFVPTQTAGYFFHIAGTVANCVHGGGYKKGFLHGYVKGLQVITVGGTAEQPVVAQRVITDEKELQHWRNSYGLLGIITAVKLQLEYRPYSMMFAAKDNVQWSKPASFWSFVRDKALADVQAVAAATSSFSEDEQRERAYDGEYFVELGQEERAQIVAVGNRKRTGRTTDAKKLRKEYRKLMSVSGNEYLREQGCPDAKVLFGISVSNILRLQLTDVIPDGGAKVMDQVFKKVPELALQKRKGANDGYFADASPDVRFSAYFVPAARTFEALRAINQLCREEQLEYVAVEFRFVRVQQRATLQPVPPGEYVNLDLMTFPSLSGGFHGWRKAFALVEQLLVRDFQGVPHQGKLHSFLKEPPYTSWADEELYCSVYSKDQAQKFHAFRRKMDPHGVFFSGFAARVLSCHDPSSEQEYEQGDTAAARAATDDVVARVKQTLQQVTD